MNSSKKTIILATTLLTLVLIALGSILWVNAHDDELSPDANLAILPGANSTWDDEIYRDLKKNQLCAIPKYTPAINEFYFKIFKLGRFTPSPSIHDLQPETCVQRLFEKRIRHGFIENILRSKISAAEKKTILMQLLQFQEARILSTPSITDKLATLDQLIDDLEFLKTQNAGLTSKDIDSNELHRLKIMPSSELILLAAHQETGIMRYLLANSDDTVIHISSLSSRVIIPKKSFQTFFFQTNRTTNLLADNWRNIYIWTNECIEKSPFISETNRKLKAICAENMLIPKSRKFYNFFVNPTGVKFSQQFYNREIFQTIIRIKQQLTSLKKIAEKFK